LLAPTPVSVVAKAPVRKGGTLGISWGTVGPTASRSTRFLLPFMVQLRCTDASGPLALLNYVAKAPAHEVVNLGVFLTAITVTRYAHHAIPQSARPLPPLQVEAPPPVSGVSRGGPNKAGRWSGYSNAYPRYPC